MQGTDRLKGASFNCALSPPPTSDEQRIIKSVRGVGYVFTGDVSAR